MRAIARAGAGAADATRMVGDTGAVATVTGARGDECGDEWRA
jgi:hypothetical protein